MPGWTFDIREKGGPLRRVMVNLPDEAAARLIALQMVAGSELASVKIADGALKAFGLKPGQAKVIVAQARRRYRLRRHRS